MMTWKRKYLGLNDIAPEWRIYYDFGGQQLIDSRLHVLVTCPSCGSQRWKLVHSVRNAQTPRCRSCSSHLVNIGKVVTEAQKEKQRKAMTGRKCPQRCKPPLPDKICEWCNKPFPLSRKRPKKENENRRFCNLDCWYEYIRAAPENHPTYKGGYEPYYGPNWPQQARKARQRDRVCQSCGKTPKENGRALDVHHIISFPEFGIAHYKEANHLSNLVSSCQGCHPSLEWGIIPIQMPLGLDVISVP